ncbi:hypothetical protein IWQ60_002042 [Tieghemiomyces parasiticus]|uniref:glutathione gamma-glutamylcysteinyltransferase n=1 Tax=Tieghemiomyces parasiticus TaxID=78921 RepID=A0A9W8E1Z3_9FUNG|nr:hypothetical protein IWQ60_002042 [Tieghemiomyces parasiticus]
MPTGTADERPKAAYTRLLLYGDVLPPGSHLVAFGYPSGEAGPTFTPYRHAEPQTTWNPYPPASKRVEPNSTIASPRAAPSVISQATPVSPATTTTATSPTTNPSFYRRQLPAILTSFTSPEGRARFKESLLSGYAEGYFNLAGNFTTQSEPAFCGPSSLAMVLNALEVDPGQPWKGVWRWYSDELIKTCAEPEVLKRTGITFEQFACMAVRHCDIQAHRGREGPNVIDSPGTVSLAQFRKDVRRVCAGTDEFMVVSFARKVLQQTGDGHFSPIGAYHPETDSVLVLDTARFKYPSFFVPLETLYEALHPVDKTTGKSRGYFLIRRALAKRSPLEEATTVDGETVTMPGRVGGEFGRWLYFDRLTVSIVDSPALPHLHEQGKDRGPFTNLRKTLTLVCD